MTIDDFRFQNQGVRTAAAWALLVVLLTLILKTLDFLFIPFSIALLIGYALGIPLDFLQRFRLPAPLRTMGVVFLVIVCVYLLGRLVNVNIKEFQAQLPVFEDKFWIYTRSLLDWLDISQEQAREMYNAFLTNFSQLDFKPVGSLVQRLGGSFFSFLGNMLWVLLFLVFILAERESFARRLVRGVGDEGAADILQVMSRINKAVQSYLGLKTIISVLTGVLVAIVLSLFQIPFAVLWGVLAFLLNFIPNIGSLISVMPPVAITFFQYGSLTRTLLVTGSLVIIHFFVGNVLEPKIMGRGLNLSPLVVLLSLVFWGWLWGIPGMLLSVPLTAAIRIACEQMEITRPLAIMISEQ